MEPQLDPDQRAILSLLLVQYSALETYVNKHLPVRLRSSVSPEDVVQDTCAEALKRASQFDPNIDPGGRRWLFTIARRRIIRLMERDKVVRQQPAADLAARDESVDALQRLATYLRTPSMSAADHELTAAVQQALAEMRPEQAAVIRSRYVDNLSSIEIAQRLGRSPAAVDKLMQRAIAALGVMLRRLMPGR